MKEWTDWIQHDGMGCPVKGRLVQVEFESGEIVEGIAGEMFDGLESILGSSWHWALFDTDLWEPILTYRVHKPKAMGILQGILRTKELETV